MAKLVFYWYWPTSDTYCHAAENVAEAVCDMDDVWRLKVGKRQSGFLATVVV